MLLAMAILAGLALAVGTAGAGEISSRTYTLDADFDEGSAIINVVHSIPDQLQLDQTTSAFPFIWVAASDRGTIVKIDTDTGDILGEYQSAPDGRGTDPSRTTVDKSGNVWSGNRDESSGGKGSVVQVGLEENGQCEDRNTNGVIDTSTGLGDIKPWTNDGGADDNGGVSTAEDECIIKYVRVEGDNIRHVSVDANNDVWTAGNFGSDNAFDLVDGDTGAILASFDVGCGGYGGLVDGNGVLWSANRGPGSDRLLRYDTKNTVTTGDDTSACLTASNSYGLGIDSNGNIWHSQFTSNTILKFQPDGTLFAGFPKTTGGASGDRGVAVTAADDNVWVANSSGSDVSRLDNDGNVLKVIPVGDGPTGVAVDAAGKVWATNRNSDDVSRIDPATDTVDLTVDLGDGAGPYNYSDMTGAILVGAPDNGTWTVVYDSGIEGAEWGTVSWTADVVGDGSLNVTVRSSEDGVTFGPSEAVTDGADITVADGKFLQVSASFTRAGTGESPILFDLTVATVGEEATPTPTPSPTPTAVAEVVQLPTTGGTPSDGGPGVLPWLAAIAGAIALIGSGSAWFAYQRRRIR